MTARAAIVATCALLAACSEPPPDEPSVRPGDSLFDLADRGAVVAFPDSNLAPAVVRRVRAALDAWSEGDVDEPVVPMATTELDAWVFGRPFDNDELPPHLRDFVPDDLDLRLYTARPDVVPDDVPVVLRDGRPEPGWNPLGGEPFPGELLYWDADNGALRAIAPDEPEGIRLRYVAAVDDEFGAWERRLALRGGTPRLDDLRRRVELGDVSRPVLLAPPPSRLAFDLPRLEVDALDVAVGVVDHGWRGATLADGEVVVERASGLSGGAAFAVDVTDAAGVTTRAWRHVVSADDVGARFVEARVDLSPWSGEAVTVELVTLAPTGARATHTYAAWSDLRFVGDVAEPPDRPHVVLVDIDTLRPDRLGVYGYERPTSPRLDAWAEQAVVFERARTTGPYTLPTTASIMTGLDVHQHDVDHLSKAVPAAAMPIASVLRAVGYETLGVAEGAYLAPSFGFAHGFDRYETAQHKAPDWQPVVERVAERRSERPLFLFLHTYLVHAPFGDAPRFVDPDYDGPYAGQTITNETIEAFRRGEIAFDDDTRRYVSDLYDGLVRQMDDLVADTLEGLRATLGDDVLVIFLSDHGEEFFERGLLAHGHTLYNELLAVPLIVRFPDGRTGRDARAASVVDVVPTILDVVGLEQPPHLPGRSLAAPADVGTRELVSRFSGRAHGFETAAGWKLIRGRVHTPRGDLPDPQLFDLRTDAGERSDLAEREPGKLAELSDRLDEYLETWDTPALADQADTSAATLKTLQDLGYADDR